MTMTKSKPQQPQQPPPHPDPPAFFLTSRGRARFVTVEFFGPLIFADRASAEAAAKWSKSRGETSHVVEAADLDVGSLTAEVRTALAARAGCVLIVDSIRSDGMVDGLTVMRVSESGGWFSYTLRRSEPTAAGDDGTATNANQRRVEALRKAIERLDPNEVKPPEAKPPEVEQKKKRRRKVEQPETGGRRLAAPSTNDRLRTASVESTPQRPPSGWRSSYTEKHNSTP